MNDKLPHDELNERLAQAKKLIEINATYQHYKGDQYKVLNIAILEESMDPYVVYQAQYGGSITFLRPVSEWIEDIKWRGKKSKRFRKLGR